MSVVHPAATSTADRVIGLRKRPDLVIQPSAFQGEACWIVKDPLAMKYFRLRKPEYLVLDQLDGQSSYESIKRRLVRTFPEYKIRRETVQQLVVSLHQNGLLISDATGQSAPLLKRRNKELQQKAMGLASSLIALRFPGWDPESFLSWLYPKCHWMFSTWFTTIVVATCVAAAVLVGLNFATFQSKLPEFEQFFAFDNLLLMGTILMVTKTVHELGHGLMCKHYGGECHEIGFMLLVLMPAMYCNTSDSWILPNRWHRMAIGAAGMYVEVFLAALATFVWWFTHPGWIHYLALNVMFLSSVSTIVFNANPLLRYDGYYILSDFLEIPNMAQKSKTALLSVMRVGLLGMKPVDRRQLPERNLFIFALYSVCSFIYLWMIMIFIFWFVAEVFEPYGLAPLGHLVIAISLIAMILVPAIKLVKFFMYPGRMREVKSGRFYVSVFLLAALVGLFCYYPLPHYVWGSFVVRPVNQQNVTLNARGRLIEVVTAESSVVEPEQMIAAFKNETLELEKVELEIQQAKLKQELAIDQTLSSVEGSAASRLAEQNASLAAIAQQIELLSEQLDALTVRADRSGKLFAPLNRRESDSKAEDLTRWSGTPLRTENIGSWFDANTLLGVIGDPQQMEAIVVVSQADIQLLQNGQAALTRCHQFGGDFLKSEISAVSRDELLQVPSELSQTNGGPIAAAPTIDGERPVLKSYTAVARFNPSELTQKQIELLPGMRGQIRILVGQSSLGSRIKRYLNSVINFR